MRENINIVLGIVVMALCVGFMLVFLAGCEVNTSTTATGGATYVEPTDEATPPEDTLPEKEEK
jgi:hypothetical protein